MSDRTQHLVPSHPGNVNAQRSGAFSRRDQAQSPEVQELAAAVMAAPHTVEVDRPGAIEIAKLMVLIDRIDADLAERGVTKPRSGDVRTILDHRLRASRRLADWLDRYGMTPKGRADWASSLASTGALARIAADFRAQRDAP